MLRWLDGENPVVGRLADPDGLARDLAGFVGTLRRIDLPDAPPAGRRGPLAPRDAATRSAIESSRGMVDVDDATWARGRGWALSIALIQLPYYRDTNPPLADNARHVIAEALADHARGRQPARTPGWAPRSQRSDPARPA